MSTVAIIGGTGTAALVRGVAREEKRVATPFGPVEMLRLWIGGEPVFVLHRHGLRHHVAPHAIRHEAHFAALRQVGVTRAVALYATGGLLPDLHPGTAVVLSDLLECSAAVTLHGSPHAPVQHTDMSTPFCEGLRAVLLDSLGGSGPAVIADGTYCHVAGPRYETVAEVRLFGTWGGTVVGMTALPEAILARQAGMCWAALAVVTNYGVGLRSEGVSHGLVASSMREAVAQIGPALMHAVDAARRSPRCPHCAGGSD